MDLRRHLELFDPMEFTTPIHIIGVGATGSWIAYMLAKLGIENITIWDFDSVEPHNIPNQLFGKDDIGKAKVDAVAEKIERETGLIIKTVEDKYINQPLSGIVIMQVDSMKERKRIFNTAIYLQPQIKHFIDSRMGLNMSRIYNLNPTDLASTKRYKESLYSDDDSEVSACGASLTVITSSLHIASSVTRQIINWHNKENLDFEILQDFIFNQIITNNV